jgi:hypothetical protein
MRGAFFIALRRSGSGMRWRGRSVRSHRSVSHEEIAEKRAIVDHRIPQVFGIRFAATFAFGDVVSGAVLINDMWVVNGDVGCALRKVADWITANLHQIGNEAIGFLHGAARIVNESRLIVAPVGLEAVAISGGQRTNRVLLNALGALHQLRFCATTVVRGLQSAVVLRAKLFVKCAGSALSDDYHRDSRECDDSDDSDY